MSPNADSLSSLEPGLHPCLYELAIHIKMKCCGIYKAVSCEANSKAPKPPHLLVYHAALIGYKQRHGWDSGWQFTNEVGEGHIIGINCLWGGVICTAHTVRMHTSR